MEIVKGILKQSSRAQKISIYVEKPDHVAPILAEELCPCIVIGCRHPPANPPHHEVFYTNYGLLDMDVEEFLSILNQLNELGNLRAVIICLPPTIPARLRGLKNFPFMVPYSRLVLRKLKLIRLFTEFKGMNLLLLAPIIKLVNGASYNLKMPYYIAVKAISDIVIVLLNLD